MKIPLLQLTDIPFLWGGKDPATGLDCFTLASHARMMHQLDPLPNHGWVYQQFSEATFPAAIMLTLCEDALTQVVRSPIEFDIVALRGESISLGTCLKDCADNLNILHFNALGRSTMTPLEVVRRMNLIVGVFEC